MLRPEIRRPEPIAPPIKYTEHPPKTFPHPPSPSRRFRRFDILPSMSPAKKTVLGTRPGATHVTGPGGLDAQAFARWYRERTLEQWQALDLAALERVAAVIEEAQSQGRFVWVCGNGGSAAGAAHVGCDFGKTAAKPGAKPLKAVSLSDNTASLSSVLSISRGRWSFSLAQDGIAARKLRKPAGAKARYVSRSRSNVSRGLS